MRSVEKTTRTAVPALNNALIDGKCKLKESKARVERRESGQKQNTRGNAYAKTPRRVGCKCASSWPVRGAVHSFAALAVDETC